MEVNQSLRVSQVGPLAEANVAFGDLTILVGPQATGKSIFLQLLKLVIDNGAVIDTLSTYGLTWRNLEDFLNIYLGEGMCAVWHPPASQLEVDGRALDLAHHVSRQAWRKQEKLYYIPAQRVLVLGNGWPRPFRDYAAGDPFVVRDFSEKIRQAVDSDLPQGGLFPQRGRLKAELRALLESHVFRGFGLDTEPFGGQKRLVLHEGGGRGLPYMVWSAGQREFTPLLLGLYSLLPAGAVERRADFRWVVLEEPEMGLHPAALQAVLLAILDLLARGYRVCLSTHSPQVLELAWMLRICQNYGERRLEPLLKLFEVRRTGPMRELAAEALTKTTRVYYFEPERHAAIDISDLDPGDEYPGEAFWGGLTGFSGRVADAVADVVSYHERGDM